MYILSFQSAGEPVCVSCIWIFWYFLAFLRLCCFFNHKTWQPCPKPKPVRS